MTTGTDQAPEAIVAQVERVGPTPGEGVLAPAAPISYSCSTSVMKPLRSARRRQGLR